LVLRLAEPNGIRGITAVFDPAIAVACLVPQEIVLPLSVKTFLETELLDEPSSYTPTPAPRNVIVQNLRVSKI
jgi:hypothetical protein